MQENENIKSITGNPKKALNKLAWPLVVTMLLFMANNLVDGIWVAGLGAGPLAAVGFVSPIFLMLVGIGNGMGGGVNSLLSRYVGSKQTKNANNAVIHSIILSIIIYLVILIFFLITLKDILYLMGAGKVIDLGLDYGYIIIIFSFTIILPGIYAGIFRSEGDIKRATISLAFAAIINMIIDPIFIYTLNLGVKGAAIATALSCMIDLGLLLYWMFIKKDTYFEYKFKNFKYNPEIYKEILNVGLPASLEEILMAVVAIIINLIIEIVGGTTAVAVYTAGWRLLCIAIIPTVGISTAAITVAGVAYGARNFKNLQIATRYSMELGLIYSIVIAVIFIVFANQIAFLFSYSSNSSFLAPQISDFLKLMWMFIMPVAFGATAGYVFQGMGKGEISFVITLLRELILAILFAYLFGITLHLGTFGVYIGLIIGTAIGSAIGYVAVEYYIHELKKY